MSNEREEKKCYLCGGSDLTDTGYTLRDNSEINVLKCNNCSLYFLSSFEHINRDFYSEGKMHGASFDLNRWINAARIDDQRRFQFLKTKIRNKSVLDFGCGTGGFLLLTKNISSYSAGVEKQNSLKQHFKENQLDIYESTDEINKKFDIITMFHVLEHLKDPKKELCNILKLLNKEGELIIEIPNENDALLSLYKCKAFADFTHWSCHLFCYNEKTLKRLFNDLGLKINYIKPVQRYGLANHLYWIFKGQKGGQTKWKFFNIFDFIYKNFIKLIHKSDTLIASVSFK